MYFSFFMCLFLVTYWMYVLILSFILGYGQLLVLDESHTACSMWADIVVIAPRSDRASPSGIKYAYSTYVIGKRTYVPYVGRTLSCILCTVGRSTWWWWWCDDVTDAELVVDEPKQSTSGSSEYVVTARGRTVKLTCPAPSTSGRKQTVEVGYKGLPFTARTQLQ